MSPIRPENLRRYPPDWRTLANRIKWTRAKGRCECEGQCGRGHAPERCPNRHFEPAADTGSRVILTVAHLDHTPENCADDNLLAMCQACHLHYDRDHHAATRAATSVKAAALAGQSELPIGDDE